MLSQSALMDIHMTTPHGLQAASSQPNDKDSKPHLLVIGCGDLGGACAQHFAAQGWRVTGVRRSPVPIPGVELVRADVTQPETLRPLQAIAADLVLIVLTPGGFNEARYRAVYVDGLANILAALNTSRLQRVVWVSSTSVFAQDDGSLLDETSPAQPGGFSGQCLLEAEQLLAASQLPHTILRCGGIYGPGRERLRQQLLNGKRSSAMPVRISNRIHRDDVVGILQFLLRQAAAHAELEPLYLAVDAEPTPIAEVERWFADYLGLQYENMQEQAGEMRGGNKRCSNARLQALGYRFIYPSYREGLPTLLQPL